VNPDVIGLPSVFSSDSMSPKGDIPLTEWEFWKKQFPDAIAHSAYVFVDNNTTRAQTGFVREATKAIGYEWPVYAPVDLAAISYKTQIREMKNKGVRLVTFQGAYQQAAKLAREMVEEDFAPDVYSLQMNVYDPRLIQEGGANLETINTNVQLLSQMVEEIDGSPELQTYREWLKYIDPQAEPTGLGMYAWSGMKLVYQLLKDIGPEVTREAMIDALSKVEGWEGGGLVPPQDIGDKIPSPCTMILKIQGGQFVRLHPGERNSFDCTGRTESGL
jgi:ABC-type branched-subunit amino acid transport system substrate-binding protein